MADETDAHTRPAGTRIRFDAAAQLPRQLPDQPHSKAVLMPLKIGRQADAVVLDAQFDLAGGPAFQNDPHLTAADPQSAIGRVGIFDRVRNQLVGDQGQRRSLVDRQIQRDRRAGR